MNSFEDIWIEQTKNMIGLLSCYLNPSVLESFLNVYMLEDDRNEKAKIRNELEAILGVYKPFILNSENPLLLSPSEEDVSGDIEIGTIYQGDIPTFPFKVRSKSMVRHCSIYAQTGHSKTTVLYNMQRQLIEKGIPFLALDPKKDGRALLRRFKELIVIPWNKFVWNPLRPPPGMPIKGWLDNFSQVMGYSFGWFTASCNYLQQHLERLYLFYAKEGKLPTMIQLRDSIAQTTESSRRKSEYHDSVENRILTLTSIFDNNFRVQEGIPIEKICELPCVIELHGLRPAEANWLVEVVLSWIYFYRLYQDQRGEELRHVIFVDEAHRIFDKSKEYRETAQEMGTPIISIFPSQFRDFGTALVLSSQQPSQVMNSVHSNSLIKIIGNLSSGVDISSIRDATGLNKELIDCIHRLKRAQWIVCMSDGYTEPFMIQTPDYPVERNISDDEVISRLVSTFGQYILIEEEKETEGEKEVPKVQPNLSEESWALLSNINEHPFKGLTSRYTDLNLSGKKGGSAKNELLNKGLAREVGVILGNYRPVNFLVLTDSAINILKSNGHDVRLWKHTGHVGFEHQLYTILIAYGLRKGGFETFIEKTISDDRRVDVLANINGKTVAIEVELGPNIDYETKLKALDYADELVIVTNQKLDKFSYVPNLPEGRAEIYYVCDYLRSLNYYINTHKINLNKHNKPDYPPVSDNKDENKGK